MSIEWKPGDVAMVLNEWGVWNRAILVVGGFWQYGVAQDTMLASKDPAIRPLVVIDPEDAEQVERLWRIWTTLAPDHSLAQECMRAALRGFANPTPRIEEPQGLGAVVEDAEGLLWLRRIQGGTLPWVNYDVDDKATRSRKWDEIIPVRVLFEGVTP